MKLAIMQPYFMPYIGYFQLMKAVDKFVLYDNIQFSKRGWFHRNRILLNGSDKLITLPLKKDSDYLDVCKRHIAPTFFNRDRKKILAAIEASYKKAPFFHDVMPLIEEVLCHDNTNLFDFIFNSLTIVKKALMIDTPLILSSEVQIDHNLWGKDKVIAICKNLECTTYINAIGGTKLYSKTSFNKVGINLLFIRSSEIIYPQFGEIFIPWLSIIDVMMFNSPLNVQKHLNQYELVCSK